MASLIETLAAQKGKGRTAAALAKMAAKLGVEQDALGAFIEVEAGGSGYDAKGRLKILFEKHHFYKNLPKNKLDQAVKAGLARKNWIKPKDGGYADQKTPDQKWALLAKAAAIDETAALRSASLGCGQIMGSHSDWLGYTSVQDFWNLCSVEEDAQIEAMGRFIQKAGLIDEMQRKDWRALAKGYNGPGQVDIYAPRLKSAYNKLKKIPDAPLPTNLPPIPDQDTAEEQLGPRPPLMVGAEGKDVETLQKLLVANGYKNVTVDGDFGPGTRRAVIAFQKKNGLGADGIVGPKTWNKLGAP